MTIPAKALTNCATESNSPMCSLSGLSKPRPAYTVPVKSANNLFAAVSSRIKPRDLCASVGLDSTQFRDPSSRFQIRQLVALYESAARLTQDDWFGLHMGERTELHSYDVVGYIAMNSPTVGEALHRTARYLPIWTDGAQFRLHADGSAVRCSWKYVDDSIAECRQGCEMGLLTVAKLGRRSVRSANWKLREVRFQHRAPKDISEHRRLFGAPVYFQMEANELILDRATLSSQLRDADRELCDVLIRYAEHLLITTSARESLIGRTRAALCQSVLNGDTRLTSVAREIGIGTRTLQRKLREQGASFRGLVIKVRRELAEQYLRDSELGINEIAYLLGYSQPSEFHRAFRAWTGTTPQRYRRLSGSGTLRIFP